ncbi:hypothetical protein Tco_0772815 [Tanacetum coccineum]|uniref:Uncharacterized protein n=1 Tax=Tanacetum coccineum TaxID=301880 RepID=A0ABQ4ZIY3_9ASTR
MASGDSDRDAKYALFKLLQMGTVAKYQMEFEMLIKRVTRILESLLKSFSETRFTNLELWEFLRLNPSTLGEAFFRARITEARFEDDRTTTTIANPNDLNIAVPDQVLKESTLHTSDKVEVVPTSMVTIYEEHGCQESVSGSRIFKSDISGLVSQLKDAKDEHYRAMKDTAALRAKLNSLQQQAINGDLGVITSKGGLPDHMKASEKELPVLKSPLEQESMFRRQEGMLRRQEQQQLAKDAKDQRRIWNPGFKIIF